jgi:hypothetical protein
MNVSELCRMIEHSIHNAKYPLENQQQHLAKYVCVINESGTEDIRIKVRIENLYTINNYVPNIEHLPGLIEMDVLDSFKMLCRRNARIQRASQQADSHMKNIKMSTKGYLKTE